MSIPESPNNLQNLALLRQWLQSHITPDAPAAQLSAGERQTILRTLDRLRLAQLPPHVEAPGAQDLQTRVIQLDRYLLEQLIPLLINSPEILENENLFTALPSHSSEKGELTPAAHKEALLQIINSLRHLLDLTPSKADHNDKQPHKQAMKAWHDGRTLPLPKKHPPASHDPLNHTWTHTRSLAAKQTNIPKPHPGSIPVNGKGHHDAATKGVVKNLQSRSQSTEKPPSEAASRGKAQQNEWILRLMSIQAAARSMAVSHADNKATNSATSSHLTLAMSKLLAHMAQLQNLSNQAMSQKYSAIFDVAKWKIHTYLEQVTALLKSHDKNISPVFIDQMIQQAWQEENWLQFLISSLEKELAPSKDLHSFRPENTSVVKTDKQGPSTPKEMNPLFYRLNPGNIPPVTSKDVTPTSVKAEQIVSTQHPIVQPRSSSELVAMVQAHMLKHPLSSLNVLIPYPLPLVQNVAEVSEALETNNDAKKEHKKGTRINHANNQVMCLIPAGPVIVGDSFKEGREDELPCYTEQLPAFLLAATPVTNAQFAKWLNEQLELRTIIMPKQGHIYDQEGRLLALTAEAAPMSQVEIVVEGGDLYFRPQMFRENHPVVHVSFWGAKAFCASYGLQLPTEAQWERAGGMLPTAYGQPIRKARYGCATDLLSQSWANYLQRVKEHHENETLPVGFFDGEHVMTVDGQRLETYHAPSPWGCLDMSGNIREWVDEEYEESEFFCVTKGGSYADRPFDLRIAARIPQLSNSTTPYTGFRTAFPLPIDNH